MLLCLGEFFRASHAIPNSDVAPIIVDFCERENLM